MPIRRVVANDQVSADRGRVALERGPIVYAAEVRRQPTERSATWCCRDAKLTAEFKPALLKGVEVVEGRADGPGLRRAGQSAKDQQPFTAIPYYAWANRGEAR